MKIRILWSLATALVLVLGGMDLGEAKESKTPEVAEKQWCGSLEVFEGDVQILDQTRTHFIELKRRAPLPCGSWISSNQGWARLKHNAGPYMNLGAGSYIQLLSERSKSEQVVIYRGQIYVEVNEGDGVFQLGSALGRVKIQRGKVIYISGYGEKASSQLIVLEDSATFENRFEDSKKLRVNEGEMSELAFDLFRIIPQDPLPVSVATLKPKFFDLRVEGKVQSVAFNAAHRKQEKIVAELNSDVHSKVPKRSLASVKGKSADDESVSPAEKARLHQHWVEQMAPGVQGAEGFLFPRFNVKERAEKKKLMEELLRVQAE